MRLRALKRMEEETHQIGTINLIDALVSVLPARREELFDIRQRSFRLSRLISSYNFITKSITDLLMSVEDTDLLLDKVIPIVGDYFRQPFTGYWDWNNSPLSDLVSRVPHADSFYVTSVSCPFWKGFNDYSLNKPERSRTAGQWKIELAAIRRRWNSYTFQCSIFDPLEFATENGAFAFANYNGGKFSNEFLSNCFIFYFDDEESQILAKIKHPEGEILDWMQTIRRGKDHAF